MRIKAVIWDLGGVLVRTEDPAPRRKLATRFGLDAGQLEYLVFESDMGQRAQLGEISAGELWGFVIDSLNAPHSEAPEVAREFWGGDRLDEDLIAYLRRLQPQFTVGLLSNAWDTLRQSLEFRWQIIDAFDPIVISAEVGVVKPDPRIYKLVLERAGVEPQEAVFLDDFIENVEGARAVGMNAIHFIYPDQARKELEDLIK